LNRAAAYLKLGKYVCVDSICKKTCVRVVLFRNEDAERDCTRVLESSPDNVKALFRRSQARTGMGNFTEAHKDILKVLKVEPSNQPAQQELKKVASLIEEEKSKKSNHLPMQASSLRRRVPIDIIEPPSTLLKRPQSPIIQSSSPAVQPAASLARTSILEPISSRPLKPPASSSKISLATEKDLPSKAKTPPTPTLPLPANGTSKLNSFKDAKQARESAKSGGGIFRASGHNTVFTPRDNGSPTPKPDSSALAKDDSNSKTSVPVLKAPTTLFDFVKSWGSLRSTEEKWQLIHTIPPAHFPALCKSSLEASTLVSILETFLAILDLTKGDSGVKYIVQEYMENFERIPRFNTLVLLLSKTEKALAKSVWIAVDIHQPKGLWSGVM